MKKFLNNRKEIYTKCSLANFSYAIDNYNNLIIPTVSEKGDPIIQHYCKADLEDLIEHVKSLLPLVVDDYL